MLIKCILVFSGIGLDIITGFLKAISQKNIDSSALRKGLLHKASEAIVFGCSIALEYAVQYINLGIELPLSAAVTIYIFSMEATSIIENLCEVNPKLFKLFSPYLSKLQGDNNDDKK